MGTPAFYGLFPRCCSSPRIHERIAAKPMMTIDAISAVSIPLINAADTPPTRFVVPIKISKAISRGIDADATVIAIMKLPSIPIFCTVLSIPDMPPNEPDGAFAITALLFAGKNMALPIPEMPDARSTTHNGVSVPSVRYTSVARISTPAPVVAIIRAP